MSYSNQTGVNIYGFSNGFVRLLPWSNQPLFSNRFELSMVAGLVYPWSWGNLNGHTQKGVLESGTLFYKYVNYGCIGHWNSRHTITWLSWNTQPPPPPPKIKIKIQTGRDQLCIFRRILSWFQMKNEIQFRLVFCVRFPRSVDQAMDHDCIFSQVIRNCLSECTDRAIWFFCARIRSVRVRLYVSENYFQVYTIRDE